MLKKLGGAIVVAAVAFAGMAASAALAVQMLRPSPEANEPQARAAEAVAAPAKAKAKAKTSAKAKPKAKTTAKAKPKKPAPAPTLVHPWDEACTEAKVDVDLVIATAQVTSPDDIIDVAREGVAINVRLYQRLHGAGGGGRLGAKLLTVLAQSIADDRRSLTRLERSFTQAELNRVFAESRKTNARLRTISVRMNAPACANYFAG